MEAASGALNVRQQTEMQTEMQSEMQTEMQQQEAVEAQPADGAQSRTKMSRSKVRVVGK